MECHKPRGRILMVEDEEQVRKPIRLNLTKAGYEVLEVSNGAEAIMVMEADPGAVMVDTILCDIRMPRASGLEAITYFREHYPFVPIVVLTGYPDVELAASLMKQGVLDYLTKPVTREELLTVIERCVDQHGLFSTIHSRLPEPSPASGSRTPGTDAEG